MGYIDDAAGLSNASQSGPSPYKLLITGAVWLLRNGRSVVNESIYIEDASIETTGSLAYFAEVISARTAVGHRADGSIVILQVNGKTGQRGASLYEMADRLQALGVVNAINLDGGGSSVAVGNDTVVSFPSDGCDAAACSCPFVDAGSGAKCNQYCASFTCVGGGA